MIFCIDIRRAERSNIQTRTFIVYDNNNSMMQNII